MLISLGAALAISQGRCLGSHDWRAQLGFGKTSVLLSTLFCSSRDLFFRFSRFFFFQLQEQLSSRSCVKVHRIRAAKFFSTLVASRNCWETNLCADVESKEVLSAETTNLPEFFRTIVNAFTSALGWIFAKHSIALPTVCLQQKKERSWWSHSFAFNGSMQITQTHKTVTFSNASKKWPFTAGSLLDLENLKRWRKVRMSKRSKMHEQCC